jgi:uncharacterized phage protein (TIGR02220 family)
MEDMENGYIKISRKVFKKKSKTFNGLNIIQKYTALSLISMANYKDIEWWDKYQKKFITIKRGSFITSIEQIRKSIDSNSVTTMKLRVLLESLQRRLFLTIRTTKHYSYITIINYDYYQDGNNYITKQITTKQQSDNKAITTTKKVKKVKNKKDITKVISSVGLKPNFALIINYLNEKTGRNFDPKNKSTVDLIRARFNEGRTVKDFITVIDKKVEDWLTDDKMNNYLRPSTLFNRTKFENYLNESGTDKYAKYYEKE